MWGAGQQGWWPPNYMYGSQEQGTAESWAARAALWAQQRLAEEQYAQQQTYGAQQSSELHPGHNAPKYTAHNTGDILHDETSIHHGEDNIDNGHLYPPGVDPGFSDQTQNYDNNEVAPMDEDKDSDHANSDEHQYGGHHHSEPHHGKHGTHHLEHDEHHSDHHSNNYHHSDHHGNHYHGHHDHHQSDHRGDHSDHHIDQHPGNHADHFSDHHGEHHSGHQAEHHSGHHAAEHHSSDQYNLEFGMSGDAAYQQYGTVNDYGQPPSYNYEQQVGEHSFADYGQEMHPNSFHQQQQPMPLLQLKPQMPTNTASVLGNQEDSVKRKAIPLWIREALEKREKQKQKEIAKQEETTNTEELEQKEDDKKPTKSITIKMKSDKPRKSKFSSPASDEEESARDTSGKNVETSHGSSSPRRSSSPEDNWKTEEEKQKEKLVKVRGMLTDVLLTVTNEEIRSIARDALLDSRGSSKTSLSTSIPSNARLSGSLSLLEYGSEGSSDENDDVTDSHNLSSVNKDSAKNGESDSTCRQASPSDAKEKDHKRSNNRERSSRSRDNSCSSRERSLSQKHNRRRKEKRESHKCEKRSSRRSPSESLSEEDRRSKKKRRSRSRSVESDRRHKSKRRERSEEKRSRKKKHKRSRSSSSESARIRSSSESDRVVKERSDSSDTSKTRKKRKSKKHKGKDKKTKDRKRSPSPVTASQSPPSSSSSPERRRRKEGKKERKQKSRHKSRSPHKKR